MPTTRIPRTNEDRRQQTYGQLIRRVNRPGGIPFDGKLLRAGSSVEEADLRPAEDWPVTPLLVEYAGNDRSESGHNRRRNNGHNRLRDIHILWKFEDHEWIELGRVTSHGPEWWHHLRPIVIAEIRAPEINFVEAAGKASGIVIALLDRELDQLPDEGRERVMSFLLDQFSARMVDSQAA